MQQAQPSAATLARHAESAARAEEREARLAAEAYAAWEEEKKMITIRARKHVAPQGARKQRSGDAPLMNGGTIELIKTVPTQYCVTPTHPCPYVAKDRKKNIAAIWEFQFDATHWITNPKGLVNCASCGWPATWRSRCASPSGSRARWTRTASRDP